MFFNQMKIQEIYVDQYQTNGLYLNNSPLDTKLMVTDMFTAAHLSSAIVILLMLQLNSILLPPERQMVNMSTVSIFQCNMSFSW